jgi:ABC-type glycerol-3-phosphate transport system substrate-binding protein
MKNMKKSIYAAFYIAFALLLARCSLKSKEVGKPAMPEGFFDEAVTGDITLYCYEPYIKAYLEKAERLFERTYPGSDVHIEVFSAVPKIITGYDENGEAFNSDAPAGETAARNAVNDYKTRLNTELMSGKGPDIILADVISYYKYADNGALLDMAAYMEQDPGFNKDGYRQSVLDAVRYKDGQYIFPIGFSFDFLAYDASLFTDAEKAELAGSRKFTYERLIDAAKDAFERNGGAYMFGMTGNLQAGLSMYDALMEIAYSSFVDLPGKKAYFDDGRFAALLESVKEYAGAGYIKQSVSDKELMFWAFDSGMTEGEKSVMTGIDMSERFFYKRLGVDALPQYFGKDYGGGEYWPGMGKTDDDVVAGVFAGDDGSVNVKVEYAFVINANCENKRAAWEFVKVLAGEEMQTARELWMPPVNVGAFEKVAKRDMLGDMYAKESDVTQGKREAYEGYMACVEEFTSLLNACPFRDDVVDDMIAEEVRQFFDGRKSAENVASVLQNKVNLYLSE